MSRLLRNAAQRAGHVDTFFGKNSTFTKQALKDHMIAVYEPIRDAGRMIKTLPTGISREDLVFADFRESLLPAQANEATAYALDILIGYYFESCDVFDPLVDKGVPNASP